MRIWLVFLVSAAMMKAESARTPVLVELFTSEGCSSCPPADFLLSHLQKEQPIPGVQVISLSEHVDYWNQLGWADPFSSPGFTERQQKYSDVFHRDGVYTPQMVVDGKAEFGANPISLQVRIDNMHSDADVLLAIAESSLQSNVTRGENRGRLMEHDGVTRRISIIGRAKRQQAFTAEPRIVIDKSWRRENLSAVVFLQDRYSRRVLGAGMIAIPGCVE
jgi:hypothetical protein